MKHISYSILLLICLTVLFAFFVFAQEKQSDNLFVITVDGKQGFIDRKGKVVIEPKFCGVDEFSEGLAFVGTCENNKGGFIDKTGKFVIDSKFDRAWSFSEGLAAVGFGEYGLHDGGEHKTGFIDKSGKLVIEPKFRDSWFFSEGLAVVKDKGKFGFIDKKGELIIPLIYEAALEFSEGLAVIKLNGKFGYIDKFGKIVIEPKYVRAESFSESLALVKTKETVDANGYERLTLDADNAVHSFIDKKGKTILSNLHYASSFDNGLAWVNRYGNIEFVDNSGKATLKNKIFGLGISILDFDLKNNLAKVLLVNNKLQTVSKKEKFDFKVDPPDTQYKLGFINNKNEIIFRTKFKKLDNFKNGLAQFCDDYKSEAKCGYIDKTGKVIWKPTN